METELTRLREKVTVLASAEDEATLLREQLHIEKTQKLLNEQSVFNLKERLASLDENQLRLQTMLKEKQDELCKSEIETIEMKNKAQHFKDKVIIFRSKYPQYHYSMLYSHNSGVLLYSGTTH